MVAFISKSDPTKTLWVVCRGTQTIVDVFTDLMWLVDTNIIGGLPFAAEPLIRAGKSLIILLEFMKRFEVEQMNFCGHSLGGAIAGAMFYLYNIQEKNALPTKLITVSAPQLLKSVPEYIVSGDKKIKMTDLEKQVYNIVQRVDFIPRSVAPNSMPKFIFEVPVIGQKLKELEKLFQERNSPRNGFSCFGTYYSLNPSHRNRKTIEFRLVDGVKLLNAFSSDLQGMSQCISPMGNNDHRSDVTADSLIDLCPAYKSKFSWGETRKIIGQSMPFPEKYRKKVFAKKSEAGGNVPIKSNADQGKAEARDTLIVNGCCCYLDSCYCKFPQCIGCYGNQTCCCFAHEFKCCKAYDNEPGKWCLCQQEKLDCVVPTTCCKQVRLNLILYYQQIY